MTARRIKHARALAKREEFMKTVHQGNFNVLRKVRDQREEERKKADEDNKKRKIEKSKRLAVQNNENVQKHKPLSIEQRNKINKKES